MIEVFRYLGFAWDEGHPPAAATADLLLTKLTQSSGKWSCSVAQPGLRVLHADARPPASETYLLADKTGVVLGRLFERNSAEPGRPRRAALGIADSQLIRASCGRSLIRDYWGRYVALIRDAQQRMTWVLRDPSGALPCFYIKYRDVTVFFSCMDDCLSLELSTLAINWRYIAAFVCYPTVQTCDTGLKDVCELPAGSCLELGAGERIKETLYWHPFEIAQSDVITDPAVAVQSVRRTTEVCVWSWASCYPCILHLLSGGLDSSIVLSCLRTAATKPAIAALNYYQPALPEADERTFARLTARAIGCELIESEEDAATADFRQVLDISKCAKPWTYEYCVRHSRFEIELARRTGAGAIFQGAGGDQVFFKGPLLLAAADCMYERGIRRDSLRYLLALARSQNYSLWFVFAAAVRDGLIRPAWNPLLEIGRYRKFVIPDVIAAARRDQGLLHPWLRSHCGVPQGKLWHALIMSVSPRFYDPLGTPDGPERVSPLLSQPLVELCLRIPTYVLAAAGIDRSIVRQAFADRLPARVIARRSKGSIDRYLQQLLQLNLPFVRELLLDGLLVQHGLLDRRRLEQALSKGSSHQMASAGEILGDHLSTEAWLRSWAGTRRPVVA